MVSTLTVVLAIYDRAEATRYFPALWKSLVKHGHEEIVLVTYEGRVDEAEVAELGGIPGVSLTRVEMNRERDPDFAACVDEQRGLLDNSVSLAAWARGVRLLSVGRPFVALNVATLVLRPLDEVIPRIVPRRYGLATASGLTATGRPRVLPGVLYGTGGPLTVRTIESWWRETAKILGQGDRAGIERTYGSALSAAWMLAKSRADEGGGAVFGTIPNGWISACGDGSVRVVSKEEEATGIVRFVDDGAKR